MSIENPNFDEVENNIEDSDATDLNGESLYENSNTILGVQNEYLDRKESGENKERLAGLKKWMSALTLMGASFIAVGCGEKEQAPKNIPHKNNIENIKNSDTGEVKKDEEKVEVNEDGSKLAKNLLNEVFGRISGDRRWKIENGNLGIHVGGGDYYELTSSDLGELMDITQRYADNIERVNQKKNFGVAMQLKNAVESLVREKVKEIGMKINFEDLPDSMREFERQRKQAVDEMKK